MYIIIGTVVLFLFFLDCCILRADNRDWTAEDEQQESFLANHVV